MFYEGDDTKYYLCLVVGISFGTSYIGYSSMDACFIALFVNLIDDPKKLEEDQPDLYDELVNGALQGLFMKGEVEDPVAENPNKLCLVGAASPNKLVINGADALRSGETVAFTLASHPGLGIVKRHPNERHFNHWRYIESGVGPAAEAVYVSLEDEQYLSLPKEEDLVLKIAFGQMHHGNSVNFVGGGSYCGCW